MYNSIRNNILCKNNMTVALETYTSKAPNVVYADCIYDSLDFYWLEKYWNYIPYNDGVMIVQCDWHTNYLVRYNMDGLDGSVFVNDLVWKNEWGNHPKDRFHQCYDNIIIYSKGNYWKFNPNVIQVPKATVNTKLNPSGRQTKTATAWIDDICLTTTSKERVKKDDGHLVKWQKPMKLYDRIIAPFLVEGDFVLDPFMGSGSLGKWCVKNKFHYFGIEEDLETYKLAHRNIYGEE